MISLCLYVMEEPDRPVILSLEGVVPYAIPALLYTFNNNIGFFINQEMDPATFTVRLVCLYQEVRVFLALHNLCTSKPLWCFNRNAIDSS